MYARTDAGKARLQSYLDDVGDLLGEKRRKASFATYALGLLSEGERKSAEPIAARAVGDAAHAGATHQRLLHFLARSEWDDSRYVVGRQRGNALVIASRTAATARGR